jgi:hypothetical protein
MSVDDRRGTPLYGSLVTLVRGGGSLPHKPEESVIESNDPGDTEYQGDSEGCPRTYAIKNASEAEHDTGPCFRSSDSISWRDARSTLTAITFWRFALRTPAGMDPSPLFRPKLLNWVTSPTNVRSSGCAGHGRGTGKSSLTLMTAGTHRPTVVGNRMDQRIEPFLADVLALAGENPDVVRDEVRVALGDYEAIFRAQESNRRMRDKAAQAHYHRATRRATHRCRKAASASDHHARRAACL